MSLMCNEAAITDNKTFHKNQKETVSLHLIDWTMLAEEAESNIRKGELPPCHFRPEVHIKMDLFFFLACF